ncbi:MAG: plasminogen-binding N-terminal domain-containing protein [Campylobacterales bacterium]|nr:plasminogen-binding N-terminal domain-containing protein [Campylobacterales bacterium]
MKKLLLAIFLVGSSACGYTVDLDSSNLSAQVSMVKGDTALVEIAGLQVGESAIFVHTTQDNNQLIVSGATVVSASANNAVLKLNPINPIEQNAIPTTLYKPQVGDMVVVKHLYDTALIIAPNIEAKNYVKSLFPKKNFINEDFFASYLKIQENPIPTKEDITEFCKNNQIGLVFIVANKKAYALDAISFEVLDKEYLGIQSDEIKVPFFTRIDEIETGLFDFGADKIENYDKHYLQIIGK